MSEAFSSYAILSSIVRHTSHVQDVGNRYPQWLEDSKGKISAEEFEQHTAQLAHINAICKLLEEHGDSKFDELLKLLQEVLIRPFHA